MAASLLSHELSDLCIGKPALKSLPISAPVGEALFILRQSKQTHISLWTSNSSSPDSKSLAGKLCMVDILCYLCAKDNISSPASALKNPVSLLLPNNASALVQCVDPHSRIVDALDLILEGRHIILVPIRKSSFCWLTPEDFARFFFNSISIFSPVASLSVTQLGLIRSADILAVHHDDPAILSLPLIHRALAEQTSVAVVTDDFKLIGEISPSTLTACDESVAAALSVLSAGDFMSYIDWGSSPPDASIRGLKSLLRKKGMGGMVELMEVVSPPAPAAALSSTSSSSDEEGEAKRGPRRTRSSGSYSSRMGRRSEEAIVCHPRSSLVAVMMQALAHRVGYVWVVDEEDYGLVGIVVLRDILRVFKDQIDEQVFLF